MSFRARLTLFFVLIVIVPMVAVTLVIFRLLSENETGKADARVAQAQTSAMGLYQDFVRRGQAAVRIVGGDRRLATALRTNDQDAARRRAASLLRRARARGAVIRPAGGGEVVIGRRDAIAPAARELVGRRGRLARLEVSVLTAPEYVRLVRRLTGFEAVVRDGPRPLATTLPAAGSADLPDRGEVRLDGREYRAGTFAARSFDGPLQVSVLATEDRLGADAGDDRLLVGAVLLGFFLLASAFAYAVSRALQAQIERFLAAARRVAGGDFSTPVPTEGRDEFAALGGEFNRMSGQLAGRLEELRQERSRLEDAIRRIGDTVASNLDRDALLGIVVRTAVDGVRATGGRATTVAPGGLPEVRAEVGDLEGLRRELGAAEERALERGEAVEVSEDGTGALAFPLRESGTGGRVVGLVAAARAGEPFTAAERELFSYLAAQAALSLENVELHEHVQRQAVTDELTGLSNHRRFQEVIATEVERSRRFDQDLGLVLLDIDNFKQINDTFGHQQGDRVLREVARVLRESCREIDEPARYGGEEMVVALPQTDLEGAYQLAERMRTAIEELEVSRGDGDGVLRVTASFGVASLPRSAEGKDDLIEAADRALYSAKRSGKNRTIRAAPLQRAG